MKPTPEQLRSRINYDPETGVLTWAPIQDPQGWEISWNSRCAGKMALAHLSKRGYLNGTWKPYTLTAHRVAWAIYYGAWPDNQIDHINGDRTDNRIANLRDVTNAINSRNSGKNRRNQSGYTGVFWHSQVGKWAAQITVNGKGMHLGLFSSVNDAVRARARANEKYGFHENHGAQA